MKSVLRVVALLMVVLVMGACKPTADGGDNSGGSNAGKETLDSAILKIGIVDGIDADNGKLGIVAGGTIGKGFTFVAPLEDHKLIEDRDIGTALSFLNENLPTGVESLTPTLNTQFWEEISTMTVSAEASDGYTFEDGSIQKDFVVEIKADTGSHFVKVLRRTGSSEQYIYTNGSIFDVNEKDSICAGITNVSSVEKTFTFEPAEGESLIKKEHMNRAFEKYLKYEFEEDGGSRVLIVLAEGAESLVFNGDYVFSADRTTGTLTATVTATKGYVMHSTYNLTETYTVNIKAAEGHTFEFE